MVGDGEAPEIILKTVDFRDHLGDGVARRAWPRGCARNAITAEDIGTNFQMWCEIGRHFGLDYPSFFSIYGKLEKCIKHTASA